MQASSWEYFKDIKKHYDILKNEDGQNLTSIGPRMKS